MLDPMALRSLTYTSRAAAGIGADDLEAIHLAAIRLNTFDAITGLLIYDGRSFLQLIEGPSGAIGDLMTRLAVDPRHEAIEVIDDRVLAARGFPGWRMELIRLTSGRFEGRDDIGAVLPATADPAIAALIVERVARF